MKYRLSVQSALVGALVLCVFGAAAAQDCRTGAEGRPIVLGISGGNINSLQGSCCAGTLGALVHDLKGKQYVLSTNTVLARASIAPGPYHALVGEKIIQPGLVETQCAKDPSTTIATLTRWVPLRFGLHNANTVDAAIAGLLPGMVDPDGTIFNIGPISANTIGVKQLAIGHYVQKMGRTSCLTEGQIDAVDATAKVAYGNTGCHTYSSGRATFYHQILIFPLGAFASFGNGSDSGSMVLTEESCPRAIGMVFAAAGSLTLVNPIDRVLKAMKVALVNGCTNAGGPPPAEPGFANAETSAAFRESMEQVRVVKDRNESALLKLDNVVATAIGRGDQTGQAAMLVMLKKDTSALRAQIPTQIEGVPLKIIESGEFAAM